MTWFKPASTICVAAALAAAAGCAPPKPAPATTDASAVWCAQVPRKANAALERVEVSTDWFTVYRVADGVFALAEPNQFQETISYLIVGSKRALMFDTGLGLVPIRPVAEQLTKLPIDVVNSHTHYDHVGGNAEFDRVLAMDLPYTKANARGFLHSALAGEVAPASFCHGAPTGLDTAAFHTRAWTASRTVADGDTVDLGGRVIEILHVPGHTPDAIALLDRANGLLWTGDTYYDAPIWLYVPETDLDTYERSIARLAALAPSVKRLLPAHNTASADPAHLALARDAIRRVRTGGVNGEEQPGSQVIFRFGEFAILTSKALLAGGRGDAARGGSGLVVRP
jgi:glyoxylase-like metal-dependent hydrolase (beta-lactamase superfamily II)